MLGRTGRTGSDMSGGYWDVRSCCWQGEVEVAPPVWTRAQDTARTVESVPAQAAPAEDEVRTASAAG